MGQQGSWLVDNPLEGSERKGKEKGGPGRDGSDILCLWAGGIYLEIMELDCEWLEEVVAALSWEKPLWLDSRLVMEPLQSGNRDEEKKM